jgi:alginate O-acetyltransferase complex protein AlgI
VSAGVPTFDRTDDVAIPETELAVTGSPGDGVPVPADRAGPSGATSSGGGDRAAWAVALGLPALSPRARLWLGRLITFHFVCLAWVFFRATSFQNAIEVVRRIATLGGTHRPFNWKVAAVVVGSLAIQVGPRGMGAKVQVYFSRRSFWVQALMLAGVLTMIDLLGPAGVAPFIYFRF